MAEDWQTHGNTAQRRSWQVSAATALFALGTFAVAIFGFANASHQLRELRESGAKRLFGEYLRLAIEKPAYADPAYDALKQDKEKFAAYRAFVDDLLYACDEILETFPGDAAWARTCDHHVSYHARIICEIEVHAIDAYSQTMQRLMKRIIQRAKVQPPDCKE
jgi:hypothetical protein